MSDTTNDIDTLLRLWSVSDFEDHRRFHRALTALVAERNELASRCKAHEDMLREDLSKKQKQYDESSQTIDMLHDLLGWADDGEKRIVVSVIQERDALRKRVAELEAQNPSDREVLDAVMMNREAELRVVCCAMVGIYSNPNRVDDPVVNGQAAAAAAKAALDALRQPRAWSTCDPVRDLCGDPDSDLDGEALAAMREGDGDGK